MEAETRLESRQVYSGRIIKLHVDRVAMPGGGEAMREIVEHPGGVEIVALDDTRQILLVRQYRYAVQSELLELPAGTREAGESPEACAARELEEETGYRAGRVEPLCQVYLAPGYSSELLHVFLATQLTQSQAHPEADERIQVVSMALDEALAAVMSGEIRDAKTIVGLLTLAAHRGDLDEGAIRKPVQ